MAYRRQQVNKSKSAKAFNRQSSKTHKKNARRSGANMRGGIRT